MSGWNVPLIAPSFDALVNMLESVSAPNQGGYAPDETAAQFEAARDAALSLLRAGLVGSTGVFRVALSGSAQPGHTYNPDVSIPAETITVEIARHAPLIAQEYTAGPVTVHITAPEGAPTDYAPLEAISITVERHEPRTGLRSYQ